MSSYIYILYINTHTNTHTNTHIRCLKKLLDFCATITKSDKDGNNALHIACIHGQLHIVQFLLQHGLSAESRCAYTIILNTVP